MLDTVHLCLHDLKQHHDIIAELLKIRKGYQKLDVHKHGGTLKHTVNEYANDMGETQMTHNFIYKPKEQPSSHYKVVFMIDPKSDTITINFSIPKFFYATNIIQAVATPFENPVMMSGHTDTLEYQLEQAFDRLLNYVQSFFQVEFPHCDVDYSKLELKRIDICFNQIFQNKKQALEYLKLQKNLKRKYFRENSHDVNNYKTAVFFACDDYSYKVYHKGTEYEKNDKQEHEKINKRYDKKIFDTEHFQKFADKILRYEFTFRQSYMSYLYNQKVFRTKSFNFNQFRKLYNSLKGAYDKKSNKLNTKTIDEIIEEMDKLTKHDIINAPFMEIATTYEKHGARSLKNYEGNITQFLYDWYTKKLNPEYPTKSEIVRVYRKFFKDFDAVMNNRRRFWFGLNDNDFELYRIDNASNKNFLVTERECLFSRELFSEIGKRFIDFVNEFQIERKQPTDKYLQAIDEYNATVKGDRKFAKKFPLHLEKKMPKLIDKSKLGMILMCLENYDLNDLQNILGVTRNTMYRYKVQLAAIGYTKLTINESIDFVVDTTFKEYFNHIMWNQNILFITNPLMSNMSANPLEDIA